MFFASFRIKSNMARESGNVIFFLQLNKYCLTQIIAAFRVNSVCLSWVGCQIRILKGLISKPSSVIGDQSRSLYNRILVNGHSKNRCSGVSKGGNNPARLQKVHDEGISGLTNFVYWPTPNMRFKIRN